MVDYRIFSDSQPAAAERKTYSWQFKFDGADHIQARLAAEAALKAAGFSVGQRQRGAPSGILFGAYWIAKWRNMSIKDREELHGQIFAEEVPVTVFFPPQPPAIDDAIFAMHQALQAAKSVVVERDTAK